VSDRHNEELISRYLNGTADADDVRRLDELVLSDPAVRRELVLMSALDSHLTECLAPDAELEPEPIKIRHWRSVRVMAIAAMLLIAVGLMLFFGRYPEPEAYGAYRVVGGGPVKRGSVIVAEGGPARVVLGGYCRVSLEAGSSVQIAGGKRAEEVVLRQGGATCRADRGVGTFAVRSDVGSVSVTGTEFAVKMIEDQGDNDMFGKRMAVSVITGAVLVSGTWGEMTLQAGQQATTPPPEAILRKIVAGLKLPAVEQKKIDAILSTGRAGAFRSKYRTELRSKLFEVAQKTLSTAMPKVMPKKVAPKIRSIRMKLRAGPPKPGDIARIRLAMQQRTRVVMMHVIHKTADDLAARGVADDHPIASVLAKKVRAKLPGEKVVAFDSAVKAAKIPDAEPQYLDQARQRVEKAIGDYDPDITGIIDTKTGKVIVTDEQLGAPLKNPASDKRISEKLNGIVASLNLPKTTAAKVAALIAPGKIEAARAGAYSSVRGKLFDVARNRLQTTMPKVMPEKVQKKVMAVRMSVKAGGPPSADELARIQNAVMARARAGMMNHLHQTADKIAAGAIKDDNLVAASAAWSVRSKLDAAQLKSFDAALAKAGVSGDASKYVTQTKNKIDAIIAAHDPDLTGIVDSKTGKVIDDEDK